MRGDESECKGCTRGSAGCHACSTNMSSQARRTGSASEPSPDLHFALLLKARREERQVAAHSRPLTAEQITKADPEVLAVQVVHA
jgi:hypothetical protein